MHDLPNWSDTLKKSCSKCCNIFKVCLTILGHYALKGYVSCNYFKISIMRIVGYDRKI